MSFASKFNDAIDEVVTIDNLIASKTLQLIGEDDKQPGKDIESHLSVAGPDRKRKSVASGRGKSKHAKVATDGTSATHAIHLVEKVDRRLVKWLVDNFDSLPVEYTRSKNKDTMKVFMKRYLQKLTKAGHANVEYNQIQGHGRYLNPVCLQGMDRVLRHTIARDHYIDVDIVNCHFVLLEQYCEANDIDHPCLTDYISNRDAYVAGVMNEEKVDKDTAKTHYFIKALYGGKPKTKYAPFNQFANELLAIRQAVMTARGPELLKYVKEDKEWNRDGSALCHMMQGIENDVLMTMCEFMSQENVEVGVLVFDGLMLRKSDATADVDALLARCEQYIYEKTAWKVKLIEKPMTQGLTEEQLSNFHAQADAVSQSSEGSGDAGDGDNNGTSSFSELEGVDAQAKSFFELVLNDRHAIVEHAEYSKLVTPALKGSLVFTETKGFVHAKTVWELYTDNQVANRLVLPYMKRLVNPVIERLQNDISSVRDEVEQLKSSRDDQEDNDEDLQRLERSLKSKRDRLDQYQLIRSFCGKAGNTSGVVKCIECDETLEDKNNELGLKLDTSPDLFAVKNGVINTRTGELRPIKPDDFISMTTDYNYFDDNNPFDQKVYENMLRFIHQILPVEEEREVFRLFCYYCLLAKHNLRIFALLTDLSGGATGKTNLLQLMFMAFAVYGIKGDKALVVRSENKHNNLNGQSVGILKMLGKRAAYFDEFSAKSVLDDEELKEKTCGNPTGCGRKMRQNDYITFPWLAKYFLLFNQSNLSGFDFTDQALLSRMLVIVFRAKFYTDAAEYEKFKHQQYVHMADQDIAANYPAWAPYALYWLLGVREQFHATSNPFATLPETCRKWKRDIVGDQNIVQEFIDNYTEQLTEPVPLMDVNGRPVLKKVEIVGSNGTVTYEQEPVLDDNGQPMREHGGVPVTRPKMVNVMLHPTDCYISMKDAWDLFKDIYRDNEKDRSKALGKSKFVMEYRRIVGKEGFTEGKASSQIGPNKARPNDYYLGYRLLVPTNSRRHGA